MCQWQIFFNLLQKHIEDLPVEVREIIFNHYVENKIKQKIHLHNELMLYFEIDNCKQTKYILQHCFPHLYFNLTDENYYILLNIYKENKENLLTTFIEDNWFWLYQQF